MRPRGARRSGANALVTAAVAIAIALTGWSIGGSADAAHAADDVTVSVEVPSGARSVWVELEQAGLSPQAVGVSVRVADGAWAPLVLTPTTFGLHGELAATPGTLAVRVASLTGAAASSPDAAVTVLDASDTVLGSLRARLALAAGPAAGSDAAPIAASVQGEPQASGALARTGLEVQPLVLALLAATAVAGGAALLVLRARRRARPVEQGGRR